MDEFAVGFRQRRQIVVLLICLLSTVPAGSPVRAQATRTQPDVLRIGSTGTLAPAGTNEKAALESLQSLIKEETAMSNEVIRHQGWMDLADQMAKGQMQLGVFEGYEFAWAKAKYPPLTPIALAVRGHRYPVVYLVVRNDLPTKDVRDLQSQSLALPSTGQGFLRLFVEREVGKNLESFFSKITSPTNVEDALDDVVDGVLQATACDQAALEAYKRRKPGRFSRLKAIAHSQPFPPTLVASYDSVLDEATRQRFQQGLLNASNTERGKMTLTLFHLTRFESVPPDFDRVLDESRKQYPPSTRK
jgi:ABC-type phosphate/phosphonate transport system substrate-binding protein